METKIYLDNNDCINKLEEEVISALLEEIENHPEHILDQHIGTFIDEVCEVCGNSKLQIIENGNVKCNRCGSVFDVKIVVDV